METLESSPSGNERYEKVAARPPKRKKRKAKGRTSESEKLLIRLVAAAAAVGAAFAGCQPAGLQVVNILLCAGFAALVSLAASRARRWTWLVLCGLAVLGSTGVWLAVAGAALVLGLVAAMVSRRRVYGAIVGALAVQSLLRMPEISFPLGSAAVAAVAVTPVLASGYWVSPRNVRRIVHRSLIGAAAAAGIAAILFAVAAGLAYRPTDRAVRDAQDGIDSTRNGKTQRATEMLDRSTDEFHDAYKLVSAWWVKPALAVPILAQHVEVLTSTTDGGRKVTEAAADVTALVDYESLRYRDGRIDINRIRDVQEPLRHATDSFDRVLSDTESHRSPWVIQPVDEMLEEFRFELRSASKEAAVASQAAEVLPGMLGGDGARHYFVAIITPAEERGLGGFMGNWMEITATDGKLKITRSGRATELSRYPGAEDRTVTADADYAARYARFRVGEYFQDIPFSPDMPSVARVIGELYPKAGGTKLDGVIAIDPEGLASLLKLTGPLNISGMVTPLTSDTAVDFLTRKQYLEFSDREARADFLDQVGRLTFQKLIDSNLPGPRKLAETLYPAVEKSRLKMSAFAPEEEAFLTRISATGAFPKPDGADFFSLRTQNKGNNKVDIFLEREIDYTAEVDPQTGDFTAQATITLRNKAPNRGLPEAIIGSNDQGLPLGTNSMYLSFYTPHGLKEARIDDQVAGMEYQRELGYAVYSKFIQIPPGSTVIVKLDLFGTIDASHRYRLTVSPQPMVNPDHVVATVDLTPTGDYKLASIETPEDAGFSIARKDEGIWTGEPQVTTHVEADIKER